MDTPGLVIYRDRKFPALDKPAHHPCRMTTRVPDQTILAALVRATPAGGRMTPDQREAASCGCGPSGTGLMNEP
jgi:23S rRNA-/tRNA-specific pseudouridylate synthase